MRADAPTANPKSSPRISRSSFRRFSANRAIIKRSCNMKHVACNNCKANFIIEPEDFAFYERMQVPPPTWCPECRFQRRMSWRNGWHLFKKKEARTGEEIFSFFPEESPIKIYDRDYWFSDAWDPLEYGRDYDFSRPFFEQF